MKILHVTKKYPKALGGDVVVVSELERFQKKAGDEVFILTSNCRVIVDKPHVIKFGLEDDWENLDKITFRRVLSLPSLFITSVKSIHQVKPDIIHSHSPDMGYIVSLAARMYKVPVVNTCHGLSLTDTNSSLLKRAIELFFLKYSSFSKIIVLSPNAARLLTRKAVKNVVYMQNGVDVSFWEVNKEKPNKDNIFIFLAVGRLEKQKGYEYLIHAVNRLNKDKLQFRLIIAGDGSLRKELFDLVARLGLNEVVRFYGACTKRTLRKLYHLADVLVISSIWEGFPLTILEAWAASLPVIATDVGDIKSIAENNITLIRPKSSESLYKSMLLSLKEGQHRCKENNTISLQYDIDIVVKRMRQLYEQIS